METMSARRGLCDRDRHRAKLDGPGERADPTKSVLSGQICRAAVQATRLGGRADLTGSPGRPFILIIHSSSWVV